MPASDFSPLDHPNISMSSFYPRRNWTPAPAGAVAHMITVEDGVSLSSRFFPSGATNPTILFFYGNGETAVDYDEIALFYLQIGVNFSLPTIAATAPAVALQLIALCFPTPIK